MAWLLAAAACTEELTPPDGGTAAEGREATVRLSVSAVPMGAGTGGTRAIPDGMDEGTATDYAVKDFWVMEFDDAGNIIGTPQYYTKEKLTDNNIAIPFILPGDANTEYTCVVVANTHTENFVEAIGNANTLATLKQLGRKITRQDDLCNTGSKDLLMNCVIPVRHDTRRLDCKLYRNVAKLTLTLTNNAGSKVKVNSVQLCNVTGRMFFADRLYDEAPAPSPTTAEASFTSWEAEEAEIDEGESRTFTYYLPRNRRGKNNSTLASQKNRDVPDYATYIEIMAEDTEKHTPIRYRFYPGENMTDNFDIVPNRHYTLPITIEGKGDAVTDSRVKDMGTLELPESNCYIVNPLSGGVQTLHAVPISRINKFWSSEDGTIATNESGEPEDNTIGESTVWVAEVIWQDANKRLFDFCDRDGNILTGDTYTGTGNSYFRFKPRAGARGNVLVGVRKQSANKESYLWSWHLWITDYNPDRKAGWQTDVYKYSVGGGAVYRLASGSSDGKGFWEQPGNQNKYVMDRNLGAFGTDEKHHAESRGFYYQSGRKDPFPARNSKLYDINGNELTDVLRKGNSSHIYMAVKQPYTFLGTSGSWILGNKYDDQRWRNPIWNKEGTTKSIFDPSPPGWKIPERYSGNILHFIWGVFCLAGNYGFPSSPLYGWNFYVSGTGEGETIWFPATGWYTYDETKYLNQYGSYWCAQYSYYAMIRNATDFSLYTMGNVYALSVRCVQE